MAGGEAMSIGNAIDRHAGRSVFGRNASTYDEARSGYPAALFDRISQHCASDPATLEIGAGTGLATDGLLNLAPRRLVVLEPDPQMAAFLAQRLAGSGAEIVCEPFPETSIDGPFDLVACAAAFHWLDTKPALAQISGLLSTDGLLAVWWNSYFGHGQRDPFAERVSVLLLNARVQLPPSYVDGRHYAFDADLQRRAFAEGGFETIDHAVFLNERHFTPQQARDLFATFSFVELLPETERNDLLAAIEGVVEREFGGRAESICATSLFLCRQGDARGAFT